MAEDRTHAWSDKNYEAWIRALTLGQLYNMNLEEMIESIVKLAESRPTVFFEIAELEQWAVENGYVKVSP